MHAHLCEYVGAYSVDGRSSRRQVPLAGHIHASPVKRPPVDTKLLPQLIHPGTSGELCLPPLCPSLVASSFFLIWHLSHFFPLMYRFFHVRLLVFWTSTNRNAGCVLSVPFRRCHFKECVTDLLGRRVKPLTTPLTTAAPRESTVQERWLIIFSQGKSVSTVRTTRWFPCLVFVTVKHLALLLWVVSEVHSFCYM